MNSRPDGAVSLSIETPGAQEIPQIARILAEGFRSELIRGLGSRVDRAAELLAADLAAHPAPLADALLARQRGRPCGFLQLAYRDSIYGEPAWGTWLRRAGVVRSLRSFLVFSLMSHRPASSEAYVAQVAVDGAHRGRGVAGALLEEAARRVEARGCDELTLWVSQGNPAAARLYRRMGFSTRRVRRSLAARLLIGSGTWEFMARPSSERAHATEGAPR